MATMELDITLGSHVHDCKDREDDICGPRGYCMCECGATQRWYNRERLTPPSGSNETTASWEEPTDILTTGLAPASLFDPELGCVREFRETGALPWWCYKTPNDQMRGRGVAVVLLGYDLELATIFDNPADNPAYLGSDRKWPDFRGRRAYVCTIPKEQRYAFMLRKANAFMDGYYTAEGINQRERYLSEEHNYYRRVPHYDTVKWYILDGDGFDDQNWQGGDYILACRIALHLTASRYRGLRDPDFIPILAEVF